MSARVTTAEIVVPLSRACARTRPASAAGSLTVNTTLASGTSVRPDALGLVGIPPGLPRRDPEPARQHPRGLRRRHARLQQVSSGVDTLSLPASTHPAITSHAITVLPDMSFIAGDTPRPFQPPVAQRDIKAEVIYCVGGVISPLMLNVALHGLEEAAGVRYVASGKSAGDTRPGSPVVVRYADDLVACCHSRQQAEQVKAQLAEWLAPRGLVFNEDKTKIVHLTEGFDFLGFNVRRYRNGKLLIMPGDAAVRRFRKRLADEMRALRGSNAAAVLAALGPVVRGWAAYYRGAVSSKVFSELDDYVWKLTWRWAKRTHSGKPKRWVARRYYGKFSKFRNDRWVFGNRAGADERGSVPHLVKFSWTPIVRHQMVTGTASPDDPDLADYWAARRRRVKPPLDSYSLRLLTRQDGRCPLCGEHLLSPEQPPQSPREWERWWLGTARRAIAADRLVHDGHGTPDGKRTRLIHASCGSELQARSRRTPAPQPATP